MNDSYIDESTDDVDRDFEIYAWQTFDPTDSTHMQIAIDGLYLHILSRHGSGTDQAKAFDAYHKELFKLSQITPRTRTIAKIDYTA